MGNWRFGAFPKLPYSTMQQLNLDWILDRIRRFLPDNGTKGQVLTRTKDGAAWVDPEAASGAVSSVNGKTGAVVLTASDVGALPSSYQAPVTSVNGMTGDVVISGGGAVDSVNGKTGEVVLTAADVGALPESYVPPAAPVQSVNGQTGAVQLSIPDSTSDLTNDSGFITAAQAAAAAPVQSVNGQTGAVVVNAINPPNITQIERTALVHEQARIITSVGGWYMVAAINRETTGNCSAFLADKTLTTYYAASSSPSGTFARSTTPWIYFPAGVQFAARAFFTYPDTSGVYYAPPIS